MVFDNFLFKKVTIIGVGLIGGSIGMAIKKNQLAREVIGVSRRHASLVYALKNKAIDVASHDLKNAVANTDLVVLATPVNTIIKMLPMIAPYLRRGCVVTDVGSAKTAIVETAEKKMTSGFFVGSHPLAGSEKTGANFASADLFVNSLCILTPTQNTHPQAKEKAQAFWMRLGARVKILSPIEHDRILSYTSHLPHLVAYALMETVPSEYLEYAAQGLKDTSRIAASSPQMWNDICLANSKSIITSIDDFVKNLSKLRKAIVSRDEQELMEYFKRSKTKREGIS